MEFELRPLVEKLHKSLLVGFNSGIGVAVNIRADFEPRFKGIGFKFLGNYSFKLDVDVYRSGSFKTNLIVCLFSSLQFGQVSNLLLACNVWLVIILCLYVERLNNKRDLVRVNN